MGKEAKSVLDNLPTKEVEIPSKDGQWYLLRILPYRTSENIIGGVILTFTKTTYLRRDASGETTGEWKSAPSNKGVERWLHEKFPEEIGCAEGRRS